MTLGVGPTFLKGVSSKGILLMFHFSYSSEISGPCGSFWEIHVSVILFKSSQLLPTERYPKKEINSILLFRILPRHWELGRERSHDIVLANEIQGGYYVLLTFLH